ncbi:hypothetical protein CMO83_03165 [Candidatus Woesearchaeota archaeon]|jgi:DNA-binding transcriptional regulator WhiA|nr:hypothetical protein [Candidatus Woesearchaeota archaeon]|tara:strand:- start:7405 stop:8082 length:678 start_codon:yes stop_codon:yes gene_type:complete
MNLTKLNLNKNKISEDLAELYGAMLGDGCLSKYFANFDKRYKFCTLITGHYHDEQYYREILQPILFKEFGIKGCIRLRKDSKVVRFETTYKKVFDFFVGFGFPIGKKNVISIPNMIKVNNILSLACIRGIFDTDGSIYKRYSKKYDNHNKLYNHLVIQFKMNSLQIITAIKDILEKNYIKTTKMGKAGNAFVLRLTDQESIHKFMKTIRPSNPYHTQRYLNGKIF